MSTKIKQKEVDLWLGVGMELRILAQGVRKYYSTPEGMDSPIFDNPADAITPLLDAADSIDASWEDIVKKAREEAKSHEEHQGA